VAVGNFDVVVIDMPTEPTITHAHPDKYRLLIDTLDPVLVRSCPAGDGGADLNVQSDRSAELGPERAAASWISSFCGS
jgi:hypothetical protein